MMTIERDVFFDEVRRHPFGGSLSQSQVDGMNYLLMTWENAYGHQDLRWFAYELATTYQETAATMQPIEEYGQGAGQPYGQKDPETHEAYYGRGYVQLTWRENYARATKELGLVADEDLVWYPKEALDPVIAALVLFEGMEAGWFTGKKLGDYFSKDKDDPVNARAIINADVAKNGAMIAGYHSDFLNALTLASMVPLPEPEPPPPPVPSAPVVITIQITIDGTKVTVTENIS